MFKWGMYGQETHICRLRKNLEVETHEKWVKNRFLKVLIKINKWPK